MKHAASNCHNSPNCMFCRAISIMRIRNGVLLLDSLIIVKYLERSCRKFVCIIMSNEDDLAINLRLHRNDVFLDAVFAFRLGAQTETLYASAAFINDEQ